MRGQPGSRQSPESEGQVRPVVELLQSPNVALFRGDIKGICGNAKREAASSGPVTQDEDSLWVLLCLKVTIHLLI